MISEEDEAFLNDLDSQDPLSGPRSQEDHLFETTLKTEKERLLKQFRAS